MQRTQKNTKSCRAKKRYQFSREPGAHLHKERAIRKTWFLVVQNLKVGEILRIFFSVLIFIIFNSLSNMLLFIIFDMPPKNWILKIVFFCDISVYNTLCWKIKNSTIKNWIHGRIKISKNQSDPIRKIRDSPVQTFWHRYGTFWFWFWSWSSKLFKNWCGWKWIISSTRSKRIVKEW